MASLQNAKLASIQWIAATPGSIYDNPASTTTLVKGLTLHNTDTAGEVVKIYFVDASGGVLGTAAASNRFLNVSLASNETLIVEFPYPIVLTAQHDSIQAEAGTASKVTVIVHGDKYA